MLIASHRHTKADLAFWRELEAADTIHGSTERMRRKAEAAADEVKRFAAAWPCYAGLSGGKDSACVVAILHAAGLLPSVPVVWFRAMPKHNPDVPLVLRSLESKFPDLQIDIIDYDSPVPFQISRIEAEETSRRSFDRACGSAEKVHGRRILGIRADESGVRRISYRTLGRSTKNSCRPIMDWTLADVYGYAAVHGVPLHPVYAMFGAVLGGLSGGGARWPRKSLRIDALMGDCGGQFGRSEWEREYYGDEIRRLEAASTGCAAS